MQYLLGHNRRDLSQVPDHALRQPPATGIGHDEACGGGLMGQAREAFAQGGPDPGGRKHDQQWVGPFGIVVCRSADPDRDAAGGAQLCRVGIARTGTCRTGCWRLPCIVVGGWNQGIAPVQVGDGQPSRQANEQPAQRQRDDGKRQIETPRQAGSVHEIAFLDAVMIFKCSAASGSITCLPRACRYDGTGNRVLRLLRNEMAPHGGIKTAIAVIEEASPSRPGAMCLRHCIVGHGNGGRIYTRAVREAEGLSGVWATGAGASRSSRAFTCSSRLWGSAMGRAKRRVSAPSRR